MIKSNNKKEKYKKEKNLKRFFLKAVLYSVIGLLVQLGILYYFNNFILVKRNMEKAVVAKRITNKSISNEKNIKINLPQDAMEVKFSYSGDYSSYIQDDKLKVIDINTGENQDVKLLRTDEDGNDDSIIKGQISYYDWIANRNMLFIAVKQKLKKNSKIIFFSYNADKKEIQQIKHMDEPVVINSRNGSKVTDVEASPITGMVCLKVTNEDNESSIYKIDRMNNLHKEEFYIDNISDIVLMQNNDIIACENSKNNRVYTIESKDTNRAKIKGVNDLALLGGDLNDNLYVGELNNEKVSSIYFRNTDEKESIWNNIKLTLPVDKKDIYIIDKDNIFVNDEASNVLTNIKTNKKFNYKGKILKVCNSEILSIKDSELIKTKIN